MWTSRNSPLRSSPKKSHDSNPPSASTRWPFPSTWLSCKCRNQKENVWQETAWIIRISLSSTWPSPSPRWGLRWWEKFPGCWLDSAILLQKDGEINKKINAQVQEKEKVMFIQFIQFIPSSNPAPDPNSFSWASSLDRTLSSCTLKSSEFHWGVFPVKALQKKCQDSIWCRSLRSDPIWFFRSESPLERCWGSVRKTFEEVGTAS